MLRLDNYPILTLYSPEVFLDRESPVASLLKKLASAGKKLFLITNSGINFV